VPVVNLEGIKPGELVLDGPNCSATSISARSRSWNDPAIAKLNPKLKLPATAITVVRRSDGSGTTFNFTDYLSKANAEWKTKVGSGHGGRVAGTGVGAKGNEGVAGNVGADQELDRLCRVCLRQAEQADLTAMINKAGKTVQPTIASFQAAASNADWAKAPGYYVILTDQPGDASWPITAATFILMHKTPVDKAASAEAIKFFKWSFEKGGKMAEDLDYIPMPEPVVKLIEKTWSSDIKS
jgi:phosphate transport system substrate-binding protein